MRVSYICPSMLSTGILAVAQGETVTKAIIAFTASPSCARSNSVAFCLESSSSDICLSQLQAVYMVPRFLLSTYQKRYVRRLNLYCLLLVCLLVFDIQALHSLV
jgi:hypothetical protein